MGNQASQLGDEPAFTGQKDLAHFDHYFKGSIHTTQGAFFVKTFGECAHEERPCTITCKGEGFSLAEDIGIQATKLVEVSYLWITPSGIAWDHAASEVKITVKVNDVESSIILSLQNSIELESELKLRFGSMAAMNPGMKIPYPMYVGMFAGASKPKPFQRKRPNLSKLPSGKLPALHDMRNAAITLQRGAGKPCNAGESRRVQIAMQHIHEGENTFILSEARNLPVGTQSPGPTAVLVLTDDALYYKSDGRKSVGSQVLHIPFEDVIDWSAIGMASDHYDSRNCGIEVTTETFKVYLGVSFVRDVKTSLEFFWNKWRVKNGQSPKPGSTHGRPLVTVTTLSGDVAPPDSPSGNTDVVDQDGIVVRPGARLAARRRSVFDSLGSNNNDNKVPPENREVRRFWHNVVLHQGWLMKKGGIGIGENKQWIKRYFVLYTTSQGHYLIYYTDFTECPLYTTDRNPRNVVDLAKTTFIRPGSNKAEFADTPPHSFDIVTTEREWTLCAESQENVQKWLKILTRSVDEDVAVLPDEELVFKVKPKVDPLTQFNSTDYSTSLKVSANGISVTSPNQITGSPDHEHYFWAYTDFYKWSLLSQHGKLALLINVFTDASFSRRHEYIFRNKEAVRLATAIEFFIEKFMTVQHIQLELTAKSTDYDVENGDILRETGGLGASAAVDEWQEDAQNANIDLLDMDDAPINAAPISAAPTNSTATADSLFGDDPFGDDPFAAPAAAPALTVKQAPPLTQVQMNQHLLWLKGALNGSGGPLYDDGVLQIATKIEVKASQARVFLYFRNKGPGRIENMAVKINDPAGLLRFELAALAPTLEPMCTATQILMVACVKPATPGPSLRVTYLDSLQGERDNTVDLPINTATFNEPLQLTGADFSVKWNQLTAPGQQKIAVLNPTTPISPANVLAGMTKALKFGKVTNMPDETEFIIYGASSLKTEAVGPTGEKISVGCLVKIEMNVQRNAMQVTARTLHPAATASIFECARALLS